MPATTTPRAAEQLALAEIERITAERDLTLRNLRITLRYHTLSSALRRAVTPAEANWSTFATWASKTAGQSVRGEEVPEAVRRVVDDGSDLLARLDRVNRALPLVPDLVPDHALDPVHQTLRDLSSAISAGNLKVFAELAPEFTVFAATFDRDTTYDEAKLERFLSRLRPQPVEEGGQALLREAFRAYLQAKHSADSAQRARLMLLGNCKIGLHEQTRLQPQIAEAMNAPIHDLVRESLLGALRGLVPGRFEAQVEASLTAPLTFLVEGTGVVWRRVATRYLMNLALPLGRELPLGEDLPARPVPPALEDLSSPPDLAKLFATYERAAHDPDDGEHTAARDWSDLRDRMNYIVQLFRTRQREEDLFGPPFSQGQIEAIARGEVPAGPL